MSWALTDVLNGLNRWRESIDEALRRTEDWRERASLLAEVLRSALPASPLYGCVLRKDDKTYAELLDHLGSPRPEWEDLIRNELFRNAESDGSGVAASVTISPIPQLAGRNVLIQEIALRGERWGALVLGLQEGATQKDELLLRTVLKTCCHQLALCLVLEAQDRARSKLEEECARQAWQADLAEIAGPVAHEFNNLLNTILLHVALLEPDVPERLRPDLDEIRKHGARVKEMVKQFQQYRRRPQLAQQWVNLNQAVSETLKRMNQRRPGLDETLVSLELSPQLSCVVGSCGDVNRLCAFLLKNAAAACEGGPITVRTESAGDHVLLHLEDRGPGIAPELLPQMFEATVQCRQGANSLELAACKTIVQRLQGTIHAENRVEGGVAISVKLPAERQDNARTTVS